MIILLGLQIFRVANQLINGSSDTELGLESFPPLNRLLSNRQLLTGIDSKVEDLDKNNSNKNNFQRKLDFNSNNNTFSKRNGILQTIHENNRSFPFDSKVSKYTKHKIIPKPYPYPERAQNYKYSEESNYKLPNRESNTQIDDSIEESLYQSNNYNPNKESNDNNNEENTDEDNSGQNESNYDYSDSEDPNDLDIRDGFDIDKDEEEEDNIEDTTEDTTEESIQYKYQEEETPECASGHSYCHFDDRYPEDFMRKSIDKQMDVLTQIMPESTETFDLVEGIPKEMDENYTYSEDSNTLQNSDNSEPYYQSREGGYICPSYVHYIEPKRAQNNDGLWKVILNLNDTYRGVDYRQHIRIEECVYEKNSCSYSPNYYKSECIQKFSNERLLAWTPDKGIHLDVFRLPIACSCHLTPIQ